jgi:hypothetical protein
LIFVWQYSNGRLPFSSTMIDSHKTKTKRGGKRSGAGRKPLPLTQRRVSISIRLPPNVATMLDDLCANTDRDRTAVIAAAIKNDWRQGRILPLKGKKAH